MKSLLMIALLTTAGLAQAGQVSEQLRSVLDRASQPVFSVGTAAGLPCAAGLKPVGNDCVPMAEFD